MAARRMLLAVVADHHHDEGVGTWPPWLVAFVFVAVAVVAFCILYWCSRKCHHYCLEHGHGAEQSGSCCCVCCCISCDDCGGCGNCGCGDCGDDCGNCCDCCFACFF
jgi:hypothetical protein